MSHFRGTRRPLSRSELRQPFEGDCGDTWPPIMSPRQLAELLGVSRSTLYAWVAEGRFAGTFRRRGKHLRFWRDRALEAFFNAPDWKVEECNDENR